MHIVFELEPDAWPGIGTERMWAEPVGGGRYRLRNSPFFVYGVSAEDIVHAEERDGALYFTKPSIYAGHSTYRLLLKVPRTSAESRRPTSRVASALVRILAAGDFDVERSLGGSHHSSVHAFEAARSDAGDKHLVAFHPKDG